MTSQSESVTKKNPRLGPEMEYIIKITDSEQAEGLMRAVHDRHSRFISRKVNGRTVVDVYAEVLLN
jgi:hypothetical protein